MKTQLFISLLLMGFFTLVYATDDMNEENRIKRAMSAAPDFISSKAMVMELDGTVLKKGTNNYVCFPEEFDDPNPMCVDEPWLELFEAASKGVAPPERTKMGIGYWLQGRIPGSNEDPTATGDKAKGHVMTDGAPHIGVLVVNPKELMGLPTTPHDSVPWVMYSGTPYAHIMIPALRVPQ
ncbi:MAG: hypothetical protein ACI909_003802 [Planctomycetota bacterium]|jgi:hypothetical protein